MRLTNQPTNQLPDAQFFIRSHPVLTSQEIPHILWNPNVHYRTHKRPATCPYPEPAQSSTASLSHFMKVHFNILPSTPGSPKRSLSLRPPHQNSVYNASLPHTCYMPRPSSPPFDHTAVHSMQLLVPYHSARLPGLHIVKDGNFCTCCHDSTRTVPKCHASSRYTRECNFVTPTTTVRPSLRQFSKNLLHYAPICTQTGQ